MRSKYLFIGVLLLLLALALAACTQATPTPCPEPECPDCPQCPDVPECPDCPECPACPEPTVKDVPFQQLWEGSAHNDAEAEAFVHWNEEDPAEVSTRCAACHTTQGYIEYVTTGAVAAGIPAPAGTIQCMACHNEVTATMDSVTFPQKEVMEEGADPQNVVISGLGPEARCMVCHQGRASKSSVDDALVTFGVTEDVDKVPDPVDESTLGFVNIHYFPAAATLYGTAVKGGYEYAGKSYDFKNDHVAGYDTCIGCHDSHSLEVKVEECAVCHTGVASVGDIYGIRMEGSLTDYDGDGDVEEGIAGEIATLREMLYTAIQAYASEVAGANIVYDITSHPYFFNDAGEAYPNWTARLLKAAYNYQMATKDPGAFAHGGKYIIQLLYDSIEDLNQALSTPVDLSNAHRIDAGHFAGSQEAFRHWDEEGEVEADCARCHSAAGLPTYLKEGVNVAEPLANGLNCATCHNDLTTFTRFTVGEVSFPSGASVTFATGEEVVDSNLCINCHQGRESTVSLDNAIGDLEADTPSELLRFLNPHYFAAGATLFGGEAHGAYEYAGKQYLGRNLHAPNYQTCTDCHDAHALMVKEEACLGCHAGAEDLKDIRMKAVGDFDGNGTEEGIGVEIDNMAAKLMEAMLAYTEAQELPGITFNAGRYPYWFTTEGERYATWTPCLLRAAYNYTWVQKDPGAFAHNGLYMIQVLYDAMEDLGFDVGGMTRPEVPAQVEE